MLSRTYVELNRCHCLMHHGGSHELCNGGSCRVLSPLALLVNAQNASASFQKALGRIA